MDDVVKIENIETATNLLSSDFMHVLCTDGADSMLLSYKSKIANLDSFLVKKEEIVKLQTLLNELKTRLKTFVKNFSTKAQIDSTYVSKEQKENAVPSFLTVQNFNQILEKYVTDLDLRDKENLDRKESTKMYDEMTDFAGAAMIGIGQSSAVPAETAPTKTG